MQQRRPSLDLELHKKYGSVVRIAPDEVIFSNPAYFKPVYGAGTKFTKGRYYEAPTSVARPKDDWEDLNMLVETDTVKLGVQKRLIVPLYNNGERHEGLMDNNIRRWIKRLHGFVGQPLNMWTELELLIVDMMTEVTFGAPFGAVEAGTDGGHMHAMWDLWKWWAWIGCLPLLNSTDKWLSTWEPYANFFRKNLTVFPFCGRKIGEYMAAQQAGKEYPSCMLDDFQKLARNRSEMSKNWAARMPLTNVGAGVDTVSQSLAAVIAGVSLNKPVYDRLMNELDASVKDGKIKKGTPVPYEVAGQMEYLQACIREAMRMWPDVAIGLPRIVPKGGIELDGYYIAEGQTIGLNPRQLARTTEIFGEDVESFRPERWLQASREQRNNMEMYNLAFGGPSRKCPGLRLAYVILSKVLASLFLDFDVKALNAMYGAPGPGGDVWVEKGTFPHKWFGWEIELTAR